MSPARRSPRRASWGRRTEWRGTDTAYSPFTAGGPALSRVGACQLPADPPWHPAALRGDIRMLQSIYRARFPTCARLAEQITPTPCSRCLKEVLPWVAREGAGCALRS